MAWHRQKQYHLKYAVVYIPVTFQLLLPPLRPAERKKICNTCTQIYTCTCTLVYLHIHALQYYDHQESDVFSLFFF